MTTDDSQVLSQFQCKQFVTLNNPKDFSIPMVKMKRCKLETLQLLLKFALIVGLPYNFRIHTKAKEHQEDINFSASLDVKERMSKIEAENAQNKNEISFLKTTIDEDRDVIKELDAQVAQLEISGKIKAAPLDDAKEILSIVKRQKRPFRLVPKTLST